MSVSTHSVSRSIEGLSLGQVRASEDRKNALAYDQLGEFDQQYQVPFSGAAAKDIVWRDITLRFDWPFLPARGMRESDLTFPQFTYGAVISAGNPVVVTACVREWKLNNINAVVGAVVAVGVFYPGEYEAPPAQVIDAVPGEVPFAGAVHMTFQGYGAPDYAVTGEDNS